MPTINIKLDERHQQAINVICDAALKNPNNGGLNALQAVTMILGLVGQAKGRPDRGPDEPNDPDPTPESKAMVDKLLKDRAMEKANAKR